MTTDDLRTIHLKALDNAYRRLREAVSDPTWTDSGLTRFVDAQADLLRQVERLRVLNDLAIVAAETVKPTPSVDPALDPVVLPLPPARLPAEPV